MDEIDRRIDHIKQIIRDTPEAEIQHRVRVGLGNLSILIIAYTTSKGAKGWSARLIGEDGQPILSYKEREIIEGVVEKTPWILNALDDQETQTGGGSPNSEDISMDMAFNRFIEFFTDIDQYWTDIRNKDTLGTVTAFMNTQQTIIKPYGPIPFKPLAIIRFLLLLIDSIRYSRAKAGHTDIPLSLIVFIEELVTGQWRQMIITLTTFLTPSGIAAGIFMRYLISAWVAIDSNDRTNIVKSIFKGTKSMFLNFIVWCYTVLVPDEAKGKIPGLPPMPQIPQIPQIPQNPQIQVGGSENDPEVMDMLSKLNSTEMVCSPAFEATFSDIKKNPVVRVLMELANIPSDYDRELVCNGPFRAIPMFSEALKKAEEMDDLPNLDPLNEPLQNSEPSQNSELLPNIQKGGRSTKKMNKRKSKNKSRHARY